MVDRLLIPAWQADPSGPLFRYSGGTVLPGGAALQRFLNTLPETELDDDGQLGPLTSQAVKRAFGHLLAGDPRIGTGEEDRLAGERAAASDDPGSGTPPETG
jgi:hypothetical protein